MPYGDGGIPESGVDMESNDEITDEFLDCTGATRVFRLKVYAEGLFMDATEQKEDGSTGLRFVLPIKDGVPPWGEMRDLVQSRLCQRDVVRDGRGKLQVLHNLIRAQITDIDSEGREFIDQPHLVIDDINVSWEELGQALTCFTGFGLRIEIHEAGGE